MLSAISMSAQDTKAITWGAEAGLNINSLSFSSADFESSNRMGFFVGPKVKFRVPILGFGADAALIYSLNSSSVGENTESLSYLEIPVNFRYSFGLSFASIYLATGPQFNYCLSSESTLANAYGTAEGISRSTWGWNVGGGVELFKHLQVGVTYTIPISNSGDLTWEHAGNVISNFKQKTVKVRLAYFF